jgi:hypothetical protein
MWSPRTSSVVKVTTPSTPSRIQTGDLVVYKGKEYWAQANGNNVYLFDNAKLEGEWIHAPRTTSVVKVTTPGAKKANGIATPASPYKAPAAGKMPTPAVVKQEQYVPFPIGGEDEDVDDDEDASGDDNDNDDNDRRDEKPPNRFVEVAQDLENLAAHAQVLKSRVVGLKIADLDDKLRRLCELLTSLNFNESQPNVIVAQARQINNVV